MPGVLNSQCRLVGFHNPPDTEPGITAIGRGMPRQPTHTITSFVRFPQDFHDNSATSSLHKRALAPEWNTNEGNWSHSA
jgi:hypothetical protein